MTRHQCPVCGVQIDPRAGRIYCSDAHRWQAWYHRHRAERQQPQPWTPEPGDPQLVTDADLAAMAYPG